MVLQLGETEISDFVGKVDFRKADGLVPVIVQDASNDRVLLQAFMNKDALQSTLKTGRLHFWSRSRGRIWLKGEESGHYSFLQNAILDCDGDAILFKVQQLGPVCHTNRDTCFHRPIIAEGSREVDARIIERIFEVLKDRVRNPSKESYVSNLTAEGEDAVLRKIGEESVELMLGVKEKQSDEKKGHIIHEATDVVFHILVLFAQRGLRVEEIFSELEQRHRVKTRMEDV